MQSHAGQIHASQQNCKVDQSVLRNSQGLTIVEGLRSITEEHSSDCQQTAGGDPESMELP